MDILNLTQTGSVAASPVRVAKVSVTTAPAPQGNSLPNEGQRRVQVESPPPANSSPQVDAAELNKLVEHANKTMQGRFNNLKFSVDAGTNINVVRIEDSETGELIRQVPSDAMLAIARALDEALKGMMLEEKA